MPDTQSFKNHTRWDPLYHFFIMPVLLLNIGYWGSVYYRHHDLYPRSGVWFIVIAIVLFLLALKARLYALGAQDRCIRLEERLRLKELCSASELIELDSLTMRQYIGLRFASNAELPELARRAVRENLSEKQIKAAVVSWRPDNNRI